MATASHAAGLELRQTVWATQALGESTDWEGFERYHLLTTVTIGNGVESGMIKRGRVPVYTFGLLLSAVAALSELAAGQQLPTNPRTLIQLAYLKTELGSRR